MKEHKIIIDDVGGDLDCISIEIDKEEVGCFDVNVQNRCVFFGKLDLKQHGFDKQGLGRKVFEEVLKYVHPIFDNDQKDEFEEKTYPEYFIVLVPSKESEGFWRKLGFKGSKEFDEFTLDEDDLNYFVMEIDKYDSSSPKDLLIFNSLDCEYIPKGGIKQ